MSNNPVAPQAYRPSSHSQAAHMMHNYSHSPLARSTTDLSEVTHEYEPDVDADGFRHPGNHHAELPGDYSPGSSLRPQSRSNQNRSVPKAGKFFQTRPTVNEETSRTNSFTFEHEPDVDAEGIRHPYENLPSSAARSLQDVVVPLDPRAGRIVITPSPSIRPNHSPYKHNDDIPNRSIDDLQDPEELHSHANMIYGINEASASQFSVPDWQEGEAAMFIEEASHGELQPPTVPKRPVATKLPIEPTGKVMAPLGNISGDTSDVGPTRNMKESEMPGIDGAYTQDGEGSAGLPFDANSGASKKEGDIEVEDESSVVPPEMSQSTETIRARRLSSFADNIQQPERPKLGTPGPVEDIKLPGKEESLDQDGTAMETSEEVKDERPEWLRAAEMMANNEYEKLTKENLVRDERASKDAIDFASAARATLLRDHKIERGSSYPSFQEMEAAGNVGSDSPKDSGTGFVERQGVSDLPEKNLAGANPPAGSDAREEKFAVEDETVHMKAKDETLPDTAEKFLGLSAGAAAGASVPAAALMTGDRDAKSHTQGETKISQVAPSDAAPPSIPKRPTRKTTENESVSGSEASAPPSIPKRPQKQEPDATKAKAAEKTAPAVPRRPASTSSNKDAPSVPSRPARKDTAPKELVAGNTTTKAPAAQDEAPKNPRIQAPVPVKPSVPARPAVGKLGGAKSAFASALEAKLKSGPAPMKKKEEVAEKEKVSEEPAKPLADARKGRARGPQKRKPATIPAVEEEEEKPATITKADESDLPSPVCEKGEFFTSRFGVEMRSMSVQTGVIRIKSPEGNVTIMEGAGTDYAGQTVVVDSDSNQHAVTKSEAKLQVAPNTAEPEPEKIKDQKLADQAEAPKTETETENELKVPTISVEAAAGGEIKSLEKNGMHAEDEEEADDPAVKAIQDELEVEA